MLSWKFREHVLGFNRRKGYYFTQFKKFFFLELKLTFNNFRLSFFQITWINRLFLD